MTAAEHRLLPAFLRAGRGIDSAATALLLGAAIVLAVNLYVSGSGLRGMLIGASLFAGLIEKYFALRVKFDVELFDLVVEGKLDLKTLDRGLSRLFGNAARAEGRNWDSRVRGAMVLARRQAVAFVAQVLSLAAAALSF